MARLAVSVVLGLAGVSLVLAAGPARAAADDDDDGSGADAGATAPAEANSDPWELSFEAGGQIDPQPFGVANATLRRGPLTLRLITDTLEAELGEGTGGGRWWVKARVQGFASQLLVGPWRDGGPDPESALVSPHVGAEVGYVHHLPAHFYLGASAFARWFWFFAGRDNPGPAPDPTFWVSPTAMVGWWRGPELRAALQGGIDVSEGLSSQDPFRNDGDVYVAPKIAFEGVFVPAEGIVVPRVELRAGWAREQGRLVRTRLGGLNPYVVPLAGAGWAEFLVQEYAVLRAGPNVRWDLGGGVTGHVALVADLAAFDGQQELAFALLSHTGFARGWFVDATVGWAPFIDRASGVLRASGWLLVGRGFQPL